MPVTNAETDLTDALTASLGILDQVVTDLRHAVQRRADTTPRDVWEGMLERQLDEITHFLDCATKAAEALADAVWALLVQEDATADDDDGDGAEVIQFSPRTPPETSPCPRP